MIAAAAGGDEIRPVDYRETEHYQVTKQFLDCPERLLKHLLASASDEDGD